MAVPECNRIATEDQLPVARELELPHTNTDRPRPCQFSIEVHTVKLICHGKCKFTVEPIGDHLALPLSQDH